MKRLEYVLSLLLALLVLAGAVVWTQASNHGPQTAVSCRPGPTPIAEIRAPDISSTALT